MVLLVKCIVGSHVDGLVFTDTVAREEDETLVVSSLHFNVQPLAEARLITSTVDGSGGPVSNEGLKSASLLVVFGA